MHKVTQKYLEQQLFTNETNYYVDTARDLFNASPVACDLTTKILIIGGGFAGLATAMGLYERDEKSVILIEAEQIGFGASGRNGGFVFGGFSLGEESLVKKLGPDDARWAYGLTTQAVNKIRQRIKQHSIHCEISESGVILANWFNESRAIRAKQEFMRSHFDVAWSWLDSNQIRQEINSSRYFNGLFEQDAFHFHPLKYAQGLAKFLSENGVNLFEKSPAQMIKASHKKGFEVRTPGGTIKAEQVVIACGGYIGNLYRPVSRAILPISTYVMVTEPLGDALSACLPTQAAIYDTRFAFDYYRRLPDQRLLWGGRISTRARAPKAVQALLLKDLEKVFPTLKGARIDYAWGGLMGYPMHKMPLIGQTQPGLWHVTGFGGHGVGPTTAGGELLASAILGKSLAYQRLACFDNRQAMGVLGLLGSQLTYWTYQGLDWLKEKQHDLKH